MDCKTVMAPIKVSLHADDPAGTAIDFMVEKHMGLVPVTDSEGRFVGLLSGDRLMHFMLPKTLSIFSGLKRAMKHARYLYESAEEMGERLEALRQRPIGELVDRDVKVARPDTPLIEALMIIKHKQYVVPVVDDGGKLLGAISFFSVLYALREEYDREAAEKSKAGESEQRRRDKEQ
ncbi:MAG: CBS domain-containing protein [Rhodospirillales bacterium]